MGGHPWGGPCSSGMGARGEPAVYDRERFVRFAVANSGHRNADILLLEFCRQFLNERAGAGAHSARPGLFNAASRMGAHLFRRGSCRNRLMALPDGDRSCSSIQIVDRLRPKVWISGPGIRGIPVLRGSRLASRSTTAAGCARSFALNRFKAIDGTLSRRFLIVRNLRRKSLADD